MSKFKKRGAARPLSFSNEEDEGLESAFSAGGAGSVGKKKIKQAPGSLNALLGVEEDSSKGDRDVGTVSNEAAEKAIRKSKQDLRNFYQGDKRSYDRPSTFVAQVMEEQSVDMDVEKDVGVEEEMMKKSAAAESTTSHSKPSKPSRRVHLQSFEDTLEGIERARDALVQNKTNLENKLMRQDSERDRLLEANPDLASVNENENGEQEESKRAKGDQKIQDIRSFRTFCGELVGMLRDKDGAINETRALALAQFSKGTFSKAEIAQFATSVFHDARDEFCSCESILNRFADFRSACARAAGGTTREQGIAQRFDKSTPAWSSVNASKNGGNGGNGGIYASAYISLSLPDLLHPLITVDLLQEPLLGVPQSSSSEDSEDNASVIELPARAWYARLCQYALSETADTNANANAKANANADADADGDGTLVIRVLLRTVVPLVKETLRTVSEMTEESLRSAFSSRSITPLKSLVREMRRQVTAAQPSPCEATLKLANEVDALLAAEDTKRVFPDESFEYN